MDGKIFPYILIAALQKFLLQLAEKILFKIIIHSCQIKKRCGSSNTNVVFFSKTKRSFCKKKQCFSRASKIVSTIAYGNWNFKCHTHN